MPIDEEMDKAAKELRADVAAAKQRLMGSALAASYDKHGAPNVGGETEDRILKNIIEPNPRLLKPLPVHGYPDVEQSTVDLVNENKIIEEKLLRVVDDLISRYDIDPRWAAMSRNSFELGFMQLNRAVFKPARIALPGDTEPAEQTAPTSPEPQAPVDYNRDTTTDGETGGEPHPEPETA